jgi:transposase-like protein
VVPHLSKGKGGDIAISSKNREKIAVSHRLMPQKCPVCGSEHIRKHGPYKEGHRYYCKSGKHTFTDHRLWTTYRSKLREKFFQYIHLMTRGLSVRAAAKELNVSLRTSYKWRKKWIESHPELYHFVPKAKYLPPGRSKKERVEEQE